MGYKYLIKLANAKYHFGLYPNNSNSQPLGISKEYNSVTEAEKGIKKIQNILNNNLSEFDIFKKKNKYYFELKDINGDVLFYRETLYEKENECKKGIQRVLNNISAPIKR